MRKNHRNAMLEMLHVTLICNQEAGVQPHLPPILNLHVFFLFYVHFPKVDVNIHIPPKRPSPAQRRTDRHTHVFLPVSKRHVAIQPAELEAPKEAVIHQDIQDGCHLAKDENLEHKNQTSKWEKKKIKKSRAKPPLEAPKVPQRTAETLKPPFKPL